MSSRGATRHNVAAGGRYPGADLYDTLLARCERAEAERDKYREVLEGLLNLALPSSTMRVPPYVVEAIKDALRES